MRFHFIAVPVHGAAVAEDELNRFLASHRVMAVERQLVSDGPRSAWAVCVAYVDASCAAPSPGGSDAGKKRIDYKEALPPEQFQMFAKLRDLRKKLAERDSVPAYAVFTNEQLAEMVKGNVRTAAELGRIEGVGPARIEKYAGVFLAELCAPPAAPAAASGAP